MTREDLLTLVDYHYWAIDRMLSAVDALDQDAFTRQVGGSFASVRDTLSHLQGAEWIWVARFRGSPPTTRPGPERFATMTDVRSAWAQTEGDLRAFVGGLDETSLVQLVDYRVLDGKPAASRPDHMVQHLVNHAAYHRGQVTTMLRQLGASPPAPTDLIAFYRLRGDSR